MRAPFSLRAPNNARSFPPDALHRRRDCVRLVCRVLGRDFKWNMVGFGSGYLPQSLME